MFEEPHQKPKEEHIKISTRNVERIFYYIIIIILLAVVFTQRSVINHLGPSDVKIEALQDDVMTGAVITDTKAAALPKDEVDVEALKQEIRANMETELAQQQQEKIDVDALKQEIRSELQDQIQAQLQADFDKKLEYEMSKRMDELTDTMAEQNTGGGELTLTIGKIGTELKGEDWGKITSIELEIDNQLRDITPVIKVYVFDSQDEATTRNLVRESDELSRIDVGSTLKKTLKSSISVNRLNLTKTLNIVMYDKDGTIHAKVTKSVDFS